MSNSPAGKTKGEWQIYAALIGIIAVSIGIYVYASIYNEVVRQSGARQAKAVIIEKNFAPAQTFGSISSSGSYGVGSSADRYIVAVRAVEGATGLKEIDVPKNVYYRLSVGTEITLIITRGDPGDDGKYRVEIDPASIPALPPIPPGGQDYPSRDDLTNAKGQIRR